MLLFGITEPAPEKPAEALVKTEFGNRSRPGRKKCRLDRDHVEGTISDDALEFILAWDRAQRDKGAPLAKSDVFQVVVGVLGYVKPKVPRRKRQRFPMQCARCECNLAGVNDVAIYKGERYCPSCEPFIAKD